MAKSYTERLVAFLSKNTGGAGLSRSQIKDFSSQLKELELIDLSVSSNAEWVVTDLLGQQVLIQLVSWYSLGLLNNIVTIKKTIRNRK